MVIQYNHSDLASKKFILIAANKFLRYEDEGVKKEGSIKCSAFFMGTQASIGTS
jgi:hypothetical protein